MLIRLTLLTFLLTLLLGFLLRAYQIASLPAGINSDEVAIGYNAYSILKTSRDEFNTPFPLAFRSFDDYKPPLYIYATVPIVALLGLTDLAVRLPSLLFGIAALVALCFFVRELFPRHSTKLALLAVLLLAISPWHIQYTRSAYETGATAFFTTAGLLFFLKGIRRPPLIILSAIFFGLELYLYQTARLFVPLLLSLMGAFYLLPAFKTKLRHVIFFLLAFSFFFIPLA